MTGQLKAVIFDFGGVILDINYAATDAALRALLGDSGALRYTKTEQGKIFDALEIGAIGPKEFYHSVREAAGREVTDEAIAEAWNAMLGDVPKARFDYIKAVAKKYRVFLFSNTNAIHKDAFDLTLTRHLGTGGFDKLFEKAYYSHTFGKRKPHVETYTALLEDIGVEPNEAIFIDDNLDNIKGAAAAGMQVFHLTGDLLQEPALAYLAK